MAHHFWWEWHRIKPVELALNYIGVNINATVLFNIGYRGIRRHLICCEFRNADSSSDANRYALLAYYGDMFSDVTTGEQ
jgi:hypothetical protein